VGIPVRKRRPPSLSQEGERDRRAEKSILDFAVMGWFMREASCFAEPLEQAACASLCQGLNSRILCRNFSVMKHVFEFENSPRLMCNVVMTTKNRIGRSGVELLVAFRTNFTCTLSGDRLRKASPTFVGFLLCFLISLPAHAGFDANLGAIVRSYPLSGVVDGELGYGVLLRGEANHPLSSYLRARAYGTTAGIYNSMEGALEFFPLAIAGIRAGGEVVSNARDYPAYDCEKYDCRGQFHRTYIETELTVGAGPIFAQGRWRRERWTQKEKGILDFVEPTSGIAIKAEGESQTIYIGVLGYKVSPKWTVLGVLRYAESDRQEGWSRFPYAVVRFNEGRFSYGVGAGQFESHLKNEGLSVLGLIRWEFSPSLKPR
jgi:hypothetical protein